MRSKSGKVLFKMGLLAVALCQLYFWGSGAIAALGKRGEEQFVLETMGDLGLKVHSAPFSSSCVLHKPGVWVSAPSSAEREEEG